jgi:hypothetical protein
VAKKKRGNGEGSITRRKNGVGVPSTPSTQPKDASKGRFTAGLARSAAKNGVYLCCKVRVSGNGPEGTRTPGLRHARAALSQLSYGPNVKLSYPSIHAVSSKAVGAGNLAYRQPDSPGNNILDSSSYRTYRASVHSCDGSVFPRRSKPHGKRR